MMEPFKLKDVPYDIGFAVSTIMPGQCGWLLTKGFFHSEQPEYYQYLEKISSIYLNNVVWVHNIHSFLLLLHPDETADLYIRDL